MNYWNQKQKRNPVGGDKKRTNWNQSLRSSTKTSKPKRIKKSLQYLLLLKKFKNIVDYKNIKLLKAFLTKYGKIRPRRKTRIPIQKQHKIAKAIRKSRALGLIPFVCDVRLKKKVMRKARNNNNFIDKTFTIIADVILRVFPASQQEKKAFSYYLNGLSAQDEGEYAEALNNYYQALQIEEDLYDRSIILYNIGLIYSKNGDYLKALKYYYFSIFINPKFTSALNNIAVIYHYQGIKAAEKKCYGLSESLLQKATFYWTKVVKIDPNSYIEAWNWLKTTRRVKF